MFRRTHIGHCSANPPAIAPGRQMARLAGPERWAVIAFLIALPLGFAYSVWRQQWMAALGCLSMSSMCASLVLIALRDGYAKSDRGTTDRTENPVGFWLGVGILAIASTVLGICGIAGLLGIHHVRPGP
jgi:hypothetical protein